MTSHPLLPHASRLLAGTALALALAGCGMKGSLRLPAPPPADAALAAPPSLTPPSLTPPSLTPAPAPASQPQPS